jgi:hypothetical protein
VETAWLAPTAVVRPFLRVIEPLSFSVLDPAQRSAAFNRSIAKDAARSSSSGQRAIRNRCDA